MLIRRPRPGDSASILPSEITPEHVYMNRRTLLQAALAAGVTGLATAWPERREAQATQPKLPRTERLQATQLKFTRYERFIAKEAPNSYEDITTYNNYYEFGLDKGAPAATSGGFKASPWNVTIAGEAQVKGTFSLEDLLKPHALEERIY